MRVLVKRQKISREWYWNSKHIRNVYCSNASICANPWDTTVYIHTIYVMYSVECRARKIGRSLPPSRVLAKQLCKKKRLTLFSCFFTPFCVSLPHCSLADKTKSKRLYRLGENKSFIRTLVGTLSRCPAVVAKERFRCFPRYYSLSQKSFHVLLP